MEQNKKHELPQLRGTTSAELGCDPRGFSRSGIDTSTWYCAIVAGRQGPELSKMREAVRKVKDTLSKNGEPNDHSIEPAAAALQNKRLTFAWLDGETEKVDMELNSLVGKKTELGEGLSLLRHSPNISKKHQGSSKVNKKVLGKSKIALAWMLMDKSFMSIVNRRFSKNCCVQ